MYNNIYRVFLKILSLMSLGITYGGAFLFLLANRSINSMLTENVKNDMISRGFECNRNHTILYIFVNEFMVTKHLCMYSYYTLVT